MTITTAQPSRAPKIKLDPVLKNAVELARSAALQDAEFVSHVGDHLGVVMLEDRFAAHKFACTMRGYVGWEWTVTVARVPRGRVATVCEVHLLPTENSILAPSWLPWAERLQPGDIGPGDVLPFKMDDPRLVPGYKATGDLEEDQVAIEELALARARVLSETGRDEAAKRWFEGDNGPRSAGSLQSAGSCGGCGFLVPLQGALGQVFGVCTNVWSNDDGKVVSLGHGCGAHSETDVPHRASEWPSNNPIIDEISIIPVPAADLIGKPSDESVEDDIERSNGKLSGAEASSADSSGADSSGVKSQTSDDSSGHGSLEGTDGNYRARNGSQRGGNNRRAKGQRTRTRNSHSANSSVQDSQGNPETVQNSVDQNLNNEATAQSTSVQAEATPVQPTPVQSAPVQPTLQLELPPIKDSSAGKPSREQAQLSLDAIAASLPERASE